MSILSEGMQGARVADAMILDELKDVNAASQTADGVKADKLLEAAQVTSKAGALDGFITKALSADASNKMGAVRAQ